MLFQQQLILSPYLEGASESFPWLATSWRSLERILGGFASGKCLPSTEKSLERVSGPDQIEGLGLTKTSQLLLSPDEDVSNKAVLKEQPVWRGGQVHQSY